MKPLIPMAVLAAVLVAALQAAEAERSPAADVRVHYAEAGRPVPSQKERVANLLLARELLLEKYDGDGDGVLDENEKKTLLQDAVKTREAARARVVARFDKDGDGKLSREEIRDMKESFRKHRHSGADGAEMVLPPPPPKHHDKEAGRGDGLDQPARPQGIVRQVGKEKFVVRPSVFMLLQSLIMERYDRNGNGRIDPDEHALLKKDAEAIYRKKCDELLARYDRDGDGKLDAGEKASVRADRDDQERDEAIRNIKFDDIDKFIKNSFEEELMEMLEEDAGETRESTH